MGGRGSALTRKTRSLLNKLRGGSGGSADTGENANPNDFFSLGGEYAPRMGVIESLLPGTFPKNQIEYLKEITERSKKMDIEMAKIYTPKKKLEAELKKIEEKYKPRDLSKDVLESKKILDKVEKPRASKENPDFFYFKDNVTSEIFKKAEKQLGLNLKQKERIISLSRALAAMEKESTIKGNHMAEAIQYRI